MDNGTGPQKPPPNGYKYMPCRYCNKPVLVREIRKRSVSHTECGVQAHDEWMRQMHAKEGPHYQRWLMGVRLANERALQGSTPHDK